MVVKPLYDVPFAGPSGYEGVAKQVLVGLDDGSDEIVMRCFRLGSERFPVSCVVERRRARGQGHVDLGGGLGDDAPLEEVVDDLDRVR